MLRITRGQLVEKLRDECGTSSNSSRGADNLAYLQRLIARTYEFLVDEADWTFLRVDKDEATKELEAGSRYYDFPTAMDLKYTVNAEVFWGNVWLPIDYGISSADYNQISPELNQRADPVCKWQIKNDRQFEVWPMPASNGSVATVAGVTTYEGPLLRFSGRKQPEQLTDDTSRADMDDLLIVLYAAAEVLAKKSQKDADLKLAAAKQRMVQMKSRYIDRNKVRIGMAERVDSQRGYPRVRAYPASN